MMRVVLDQAGLDRETIHEIKKSVGQGGADSTWVSPDGTIWVDDGDGNAEPVGHVNEY